MESMNDSEKEFTQHDLMTHLTPDGVCPKCGRSLKFDHDISCRLILDEITDPDNEPIPVHSCDVWCSDEGCGFTVNLGDFIFNNEGKEPTFSAISVYQCNAEVID